MSSLQGREIERGVESNKADLEAKSVSEAAKQLGSEAAKCNILLSPLEGEKKFLGELCELRNFREGYKKYNLLLGKYAQPTFETGYSLLTAYHSLTKRSFHVSRLTFPLLEIKDFGPPSRGGHEIISVFVQNFSSLLGREIERGVESNKADLDVKMQRGEEAKSVSEAAKKLGSEAAKCNILLSPLEGEKKFLGELCELRNFREGYKKYKNSDRATECAMTCF